MAMPARGGTLPGATIPVTRPEPGGPTLQLRGLLLDLDGTLLDLDLEAFLRRYFAALGSAAARRFPGVDLMQAVLAGTAEMQRRHPGLTNKQVFDRDIRERTGIDMDADWDVFEDFYRDVFPTLGDGYGPVPGAREAIAQARALGIRIAVATQPIFPGAAIRHRLAWAGLADVEFDAITTYETMFACKPDAAYFEQTAAMIGCAPAECLMVGDDRDMDMPAGALGMRTFYVGSDPEAPADHRGTMEDLAALLRRDAS
jgi:FMN phosphatase YigB (HAD superfamily)